MGEEREEGEEREQKKHKEKKQKIELPEDKKEYVRIIATEGEHSLRFSCIKVDDEFEQEFVSHIENDTLKNIAEEHSKVKEKRTYTIEREYINRDQYIAEYAKRVANGVCQLCGKNAPFNNKEGKPYLEAHHIEWLSKGGEDTIDNVVALCPNCHRKMHILDDLEDKEFLKRINDL